MPGKKATTYKILNLGHLIFSCRTFIVTQIFKLENSKIKHYLTKNISQNEWNAEISIVSGNWSQWIILWPTQSIVQYDEHTYSSNIKILFSYSSLIKM